MLNRQIERASLVGNINGTPGAAMARVEIPSPPTPASRAPEAVDLSKESKATKKLYGLDDDVTTPYGTNLLRARHLVERGVPFIQVYSWQSSSWDAHHDIEQNHGQMSKIVDKPIAGLLTDLKSRGLLDTTLVVWTAEFGRTPYSNATILNQLGLNHVNLTFLHEARSERPTVVYGHVVKDILAGVTRSATNPGLCSGSSCF